MTNYRILIVDDHPIVRQGYSQLIGNQPDLDVCGAVDNEVEALKLAKSVRPNLVIVDITLKDSNGIELVKELRMQDGRAKIMVISAHDENLYAERALEAGALGYINKQEATERLIEAIRQVLAGEVYVSEQITRRLLKRRVSGKDSKSDESGIATLTDRELQVFELTGHGKTTKQIATQFCLSPKTIERYKENVKRKMGIANATELVQRATRWVLERG